MLEIGSLVFPMFPTIFVKFCVYLLFLLLFFLLFIVNVCFKVAGPVACVLVCGKCPYPYVPYIPSYKYNIKLTHVFYNNNVYIFNYNTVIFLIHLNITLLSNTIPQPYVIISWFIMWVQFKLFCIMLLRYIICTLVRPKSVLSFRPVLSYNV